MIRRPTLASILAFSVLALVQSGSRSVLAQDPVPAPEIFADLPAPTPVPEETGTRPAMSPAGVEQTPTFEPTEAPSLLDEAVIPAQAPGTPPVNQPGAMEKPGEGVATVPPTAPSGESFFLPADRLKTGPNAVGVTVEVRAPEVANLNLDSVFWILVKNSGPTEATNIGVRYPTSDKFAFMQSDPPPTRQDPNLYWQINVLPAGAEKIIKVTIHPKVKDHIDHAVTVTMQAGAKARTVVREPILKVELRPSKKEILNGNPVTYDISVRNDGDYLARDVVIKAKLGSGLSHKRGTDLVLPVADLQGHESGTLKPGETVTARLEVDARAMGKQSCAITVVSPDLTSEVSTSVDIDVVEPQLSLSVVGPPERYTDTVATYRLTLTNTGTATARKVQVAAQVPSGGDPRRVEPKAIWQAKSRAFFWLVPELTPGETQEFTVEVQMGGIGVFQLHALAKADEPPVRQVSASAHTDIRGVSRVRVSLFEPRGVLDEGEETEYEIRLRNDGSKAASNVRISGTVSDNLQVLSFSGPDGKSQPVPQGSDGHTVTLPTIDHIPIGGELLLTFRVRALRAGDANCQVTMMHDDIQTGLMSNSVLTRITAAANPPNRK